MRIELKEERFLTQKGLERRATFTIYGDELYPEDYDNKQLIGQPIPIQEIGESFIDKEAYDAYIKRTTAMCQNMVEHYGETLESTITEIPLVPEEPEIPEEPEEPEIPEIPED